MMKTTLAAAVAVASLLGAAPAFAADMQQPYPTKAPPLVAVAPPFSWTGFYLGGNAGYGWGSGKEGIDNLSPDGFLGGGQVGFNYQFGNNVVLGAEADFQGSNLKDSGYNGVFDTRSKMDYFGTVRGRIGYAFDNVLPYLTGGLAWGHNEIENLDLGITSDNTHVGWTVGGGLEYALSNNWTVKAEYLYMDLGDEFYDSIGDDAGLKASTARIGVNYKF
ncbi:outer membrane protein [Starkeya sp. ORNL1]|uniref:outer membrane protein n=1 Tax=Starkeya sp. ORNL1 TaxID=2709380 RepID=UPI001FEE0456|nr:outer membrane protein [Starkeya sp. ORNL1]